MSTSIYFTFDRDDEGARRDEWDPWAEANGLEPSATGTGMAFRKGQIEVDYRTKRHISFSTYHMGPEMPALIGLALRFWLRFGGSMAAPPEVIALIMSAWSAAHPPVAESDPPALAEHLVDAHNYSADELDGMEHGELLTLHQDQYHPHTH